MADFAEAIDNVLAHEGGFVDHPEDPGGATNWGISSRFLAGLGDDRKVQNLTRGDAIDLYREHFWERYRYDEIPHDVVAVKTFATCVNTGPAAAHKILQRAVRACGASHVDDDGALGSITLRAVERAPEALLLVAMRSEQAGHYRFLVALRPKLGAFTNGWLSRAYEDGFSVSAITGIL